MSNQINLHQLILYLYYTTYEYTNQSEDEIKFQLVREFLLANGNYDLGDVNIEEWKELLSHEPIVYQQLLDQLLLEESGNNYKTFEDFEMEIVKKIVMTTPDRILNDNTRRITTTFLNKLKVVQPKVANLFSNLFTQLYDLGVDMFVPILVIGTCIYFKYFARFMRPSRLIRFVAMFVQPTVLQPIAYVIETIEYTVLDLPSEMTNQFDSIITWLMDKMILLIQYSPLRGISHLIENQVAPTTNILLPPITEPTQNLLYWINMFMGNGQLDLQRVA